MKRIVSFLCVLMSLCMIFAACTPKDGEVTPEPATEQPTEQAEQPTEEPEQPTDEPTEDPTEDPSMQEPANPYAPTRADLDEHDYNAVRSFLEIADENGVKNGEKLSAKYGLVYNPDDPGTWSEYVEVSCYALGDDYDDIRFQSNNFYWDENGKLCYAGFSSSEPLVGKLDLSECGRLYRLAIGDADVTEIDISDCDVPIISAHNCPKLERIITGGMPSRYVYISGCPNLKVITWVMMDTRDILQQAHDTYVGNVQNFIDADVTFEADGGGYIDIVTRHDKEDSEHYLELFSAKAVPEEGHEFLGWYDLDGNLVSTDAEIIIQDCYGNYPNLVDLVGSTTVHVIDKFSE